MAKKTYDESSWQELGAHCSFCERRADEASRDVENWLKTYFMRDKVGDVFGGKISRITNFGVFVTLDDVHIDGMIHVSELGEDYFQYREDLMAMIGERSGVRFDVGDRVQVKVARADLETSRIDLLLISEVKKSKKSRKSTQFDDRLPEEKLTKKSSKKIQIATSVLDEAARLLAESDAKSMRKAKRKKADKTSKTTPKARKKTEKPKKSVKIKPKSESR